MGNPVTSFAKDMREIAESLDTDARELRQLARAFWQTGNDRVSEKLEQIALSLSATAGAVRDVKDEGVDARLCEARGQTAGVLKALLSAVPGSGETASQG